MRNDLASTGDTQAISAQEHQPYGFVDSCIALIENLLESQSVPALMREPAKKSQP